MGLVHLVRLEHAQEEVVRIVGRDLGADQADSMGDPVDMPVDRHQRQPEREQQQDRRGLLADAVDPGQPVPRLERGHAPEELQGVVTALLAELTQGCLDPRRLLVGEAARTDRVDQLRERRPLHRRPIGRPPIREAAATPAGARVVRLNGAIRWVPMAQRLERDLGVDVGTVLGQDRQD